MSVPQGQDKIRTYAVVRPIGFYREFRPKARGVRPLFRTHDGEVVADVKWPGMYRIKWRDGRVSDMVNYTRAVDALRRASP